MEWRVRRYRGALSTTSVSSAWNGALNAFQVVLSIVIVEHFPLLSMIALIHRESTEE
jgi:hypothetical protein